MSRADNVEIMKRLRDNDETALQVVFSEVVPKLWPLLQQKFRESLTPGDIEDIVAESLFKLWQRRHRLDVQNGDLNGWLFVIMRNTALDVLRKRRVKTVETLTVAPISESIPCSDSEKFDVLKKAIHVLSPREQQVLLPLFDRSGTTVLHLAESLGLSPGAVRQLRFRALRKLEAELAAAGFAVSRERRPLGSTSTRIDAYESIYR
jgi:RNA polymerase sigma factor (sigma-70 family)